MAAGTEVLEARRRTRKAPNGRSEGPMLRPASRPVIPMICGHRHGGTEGHRNDKEAEEKGASAQHSAGRHADCYQSGGEEAAD